MKPIDLDKYDVAVHTSNYLMDESTYSFEAEGWTLIDVFAVNGMLAFVVARPKANVTENVKDFAKYVREVVAKEPPKSKLDMGQVRHSVQVN